MLPGRIAQLEPVTARIVKIELPSRKITFGAVMELDNGDFLFVKNLARLHERFRADGKGMMDALLDVGDIVHRLLTLAEQDVVVDDVKAGHDCIAEPP